MNVRERLKLYAQDWSMRFMDELRAGAIGTAEGNVLEIGFGTARNLEHYGRGVERLTGLDPIRTEGYRAVEERINRARYPIHRIVLRAGAELPFDAGHFDSIVTTWTLCSIAEPLAALTEMRRVLKPGGRYLFIEHGRSWHPSTARWQDWLNPIWCRVMGGCNINRPIEQLIETAGFSFESLQRFRHRGPGLVAHMYRGVAKRN